MTRYIENLALLYISQSEFEKAEPLVLRQLGIAEAVPDGDDLAVAKALGNLGDLYRITGKYAEAEPLLRQSLETYRQSLNADDPSLAVSLTDLGNLLGECGRYSEAETLFEEALRIWKDADDHDIQTGVYNLGCNYYRQGDYIAAEPLLKRSVELMRQMYGPDHPELGYDLNLLANLYTELGLRREAEDLYREAIGVSEAALGEDNPDVARHLNNLALFYSRVGRPVEAEPLLLRAVAILKKALPPGHPETANALESLADHYAATGQYARAAALYEETIDVFASIGSGQHPKVSTLQISLGETYRYLGQYDRVEPLYTAASKILEANRQLNHPAMARCLELGSSHLRHIDKIEDALTAAAGAFAIRRANLMNFSTILSERDALVYSDFLRRSADAYLSCLLQQGFDSQYASEAAEVVLASKGIVTDVIAERLRALTREADPETQVLRDKYAALKMRISRLHIAGSEHADPMELLALLDSLGSEANNLESELARMAGGSTSIYGDDGTITEQTLAALPSNTVLIEFANFIDRAWRPDANDVPHVIAIVMRRQEHPVVIDLGNASPIDRLVERYRRHMGGVSKAGRPPTIIDLEEYREIASRLHDLVWRPLKPHCDSVDLILIAPDGPLSLVSFAGLTDPQGSYLVENRTIHHLSAGRDVIRLQDSSEPGQGLFALGDPDYNAAVDQRLSPSDNPPAVTATDGSGEATTRNIRSGCGELENITVEALPYTRDEVISVAASWESATGEPVTVRLGPGASEESVKVRAPGSRAIHLATHGYYLAGTGQSEILAAGDVSRGRLVGENPLLQSGLFLAGANLHGQGADVPGAEDGILTAYEVSALNLEGTELVVLSACETGLGEVKEGEGVHGLRRAFQMAGARTVVSALWSVPDLSTAQMISELYLHSDQPMPVRLHEAQLAQLDRLGQAGLPDHPYLWAGFIALGDWR